VEGAGLGGKLPSASLEEEKRGGSAAARCCGNEKRKKKGPQVTAPRGRVTATLTPGKKKARDIDSTNIENFECPEFPGWGKKEGLIRGKGKNVVFGEGDVSDLIGEKKKRPLSSG